MKNLKKDLFLVKKTRLNLPKQQFLLTHNYSKRFNNNFSETESKKIRYCFILYLSTNILDSSLNNIAYRDKLWPFLKMSYPRLQRFSLHRLIIILLTILAYFRSIENLGALITSLTLMSQTKIIIRQTPLTLNKLLRHFYRLF